MSDWYSDDPIEDLTNQPRRSKSFFAVALLLIVGFFIQSTFAGNISLNSGNILEFGQGILQTASCDKSITLTPQSTFANVSGAGGYNFSSVTISNLDTTVQGCAGRTLTMKAYGDTGTSLTTISIAIASDGTFTSSDGSLTNQGAQGSSSSVMLTLTSPIAAASVSKVTLESGSTVLTCATGGTCVVGNIGPGGGIVFYVDAGGGFSCGPTFTSTCNYLEVAPYGWNTGADPLKNWAIVSYQSTSVSGIVNESTPFTDPSEIGLGYKYSLAILAQGNDVTTAAGLARSYTGGSRSDWYLPTTTELNLLCRWNHGQAQSTTAVCNGGVRNSGTGAGSSGFAADYYQSSSQGSPTLNWVQQFGTVNGVGNQGGGLKSASYLVRPIRAF